MTKKLNQLIWNAGPAGSMGNLGGRLGRHLLEEDASSLPKNTQMK